MTKSKKIRNYCAFIFIVGLVPVSGFAQTCATGKVDERVAAFIKTHGPGKTLAELKASPITEVKNNGPVEFKKLPEDSVKRIRITKDNIAMNVIRPNAKRDLPVIINFHGGGFVMPLLPSMEYDALVMARKFDAVVFDVDYRVPPEFKFPTPANDAYAAYKWVVEHAKEYGGDASKIILTGESAGANLIALTALKAKKEGTHQPIKLVVMSCPPTDNPMTSYYDSFETNAKGYSPTKDEAFFYVQTYLDKSEWYKNNPEVWPMYAQDVKGFPPSLIFLAEFDILRDEGLAFGRKLEKAGNKVQIVCYPHQLHCLMGLPSNAGERKQQLATMSDAIKNALKP